MNPDDEAPPACRRDPDGPLRYCPGPGSKPLLSRLPAPPSRVYRHQTALSWAAAAAVALLTWWGL